MATTVAGKLGYREICHVQQWTPIQSPMPRFGMLQCGSRQAFTTVVQAQAQGIEQSRGEEGVPKVESPVVVVTEALVKLLLFPWAKLAASDIVFLLRRSWSIMLDQRRRLKKFLNRHSPSMEVLPSRAVGKIGF